MKLMGITAIALAAAINSANAQPVMIIDVDTGKTVDVLDFALAPASFFGRHLQFKNVKLFASNVYHTRFELILDGKALTSVFAIIPETELAMKRHLFENCRDVPVKDKCTGEIQGRWDAAGWLYEATFTWNLPPV